MHWVIAVAALVSAAIVIGLKHLQDRGSSGEPSEPVSAPTAPPQISLDRTNAARERLAKEMSSRAKIGPLAGLQEQGSTALAVDERVLASAENGSQDENHGKDG